MSARPEGLIGPIIIGIGLILAAIVFAIVNTLLQDVQDDDSQQFARLEAQISQQAGRITVLEGEIETATAARKALEAQIQSLATAPRADPVPDTPTQPLIPQDGTDGTGEQPANENLTQELNMARERFNRNVTQPGNRFMLETLGKPRQAFSNDCQAVTNPRLTEVLETRRIGNFRVTMLRPALDSFEKVMARLKASDPDIYESVGTAGALCARLIRGSATGISNHSWGTAVDLTIEGKLDRFGDGTTQFALLILAEYFNEEGWYWGAGYGREDAMHFEAGQELVRSWVESGGL